MRSAPGRMALVGNPFDIYGGKTISLTLKDLRSVVEVMTPPISKHGKNKQVIHSDIFKPGNQRKAQRRELEFATIETLDLQHHCFEHYDGSNMPYESALARSTAAVVAMIKSYNKLFRRGIMSRYVVAERAWAVERKLGVCGGQERYAVAFDDEELPNDELEKLLLDVKNHKKIHQSRPGKLFFMDFAGREDHHFTGNYAHIEDLKVPKINFAIAYLPAEKHRMNSFNIHQELREEYLNGSRDLINDFRDNSDKNTLQAFKTLDGNFNPEVLANCMTESLNCRFEMYKAVLGLEDDLITQDVFEMIDVAKNAGIKGYNQPGSKSLCFMYEDKKQLQYFKDAGYEIIKVVQ